MGKILFVFFALTALTIPTICSAAQPNPGPYVSGFLGTALPSDRYSTGPDLNDVIRFNPGVDVGGTAGFDLGYVRLEGELSYKQGNIRRIDDQLTGINYYDIHGRIGALALMGNIFFDLHNPSPITPYIGGGIGAAFLNLDNIYGTSNSTGDRVQLYPSDHETNLAYQGGAGLNLAITRRISLDLGYRYFMTNRTRFNNGSTVENDLRFESNNVAIGLRVKF